MTVYRYFTKDSLIEAAKAGNERGYNRQLDPDKLTDLEFTEFLPITFTLPHEHIAGELVEPHIRAQVMVGPDESVMIDMSTERFNALPVYDTDLQSTLTVNAEDNVDGSHRLSTQK